VDSRSKGSYVGGIEPGVLQRGAPVVERKHDSPEAYARRPDQVSLLLTKWHRFAGTHGNRNLPRGNARSQHRRTRQSCYIFSQSRSSRVVRPRQCNIRYDRIRRERKKDEAVNLPRWTAPATSTARISNVAAGGASAALFRSATAAWWMLYFSAPAREGKSPYRHRSTSYRGHNMNRLCSIDLREIDICQCIA
jgi:hypothetical protein